ncbi:S-layer family protein, partial [Limnohabitans sp. JirII-31]|uniref:beta strand repeat-containing protein n=1 Tax=Limnohabitans sp. JirII-31 TaxID=1977908 RepID=UPI000CADD701
MSTNAKFYVFDANGFYIDWSYSSVSGLSVTGKEAVLIGGSGADAFFVGNGTSADLTYTGGGNDIIYLTGNFSDYSKVVDADNGIYTFTRNNLASGQTEVIKFKSDSDHDILYFADGHVDLSFETTQPSGTALADPDTGVFRQILVTDLVSGGTPTEPFKNLPTPGTQATKVYIFDPDGLDVPSAAVEGESMVVVGGSGADRVYVKAATSMDFIFTGGGNDIIYLTGNFSDYSKVVDADNGIYTFTRNNLASGQTEVIKFKSDSDHDTLYFADGHVDLSFETTQPSGTALADPDTGVFRQILVTDLVSGGTPGVDDSVATALSTLSTAATSNSASDSSPGVEVYAAAGVSGVKEDNLKAINSVLNTTGVSGTSVDTTAEVQALVDAYKAVLAGADGDASDNNVSVTASQYGLLGMEGLGEKSTSLLNDVVDGKVQTAVDTAAELQVLASAAQAVIAGAAGTSSPTLAQLQALGVSGVTADNLGAVQAAIANTADDGSGVSSLSALQSVVSAAVTIASALSTLSEAATNDSASESSPGVEVYAAAGVSGVKEDNLKAINSVLNTTGVSGTSVDTTAEVQALVDAYKAVLAGADGDASDNNVSVTASQYGLLGMEGLGEKSTSLLNDVVDGKVQTAVDTAAELQVLASAAEAIFSQTSTLETLNLLGLKGVSSAKLAAIQSAIATALTNGDDLSSLVNLQTIVSSINNPPVLDSTISVSLPTILEDDPSPANGATGTSSLVSDLVSLGLGGNVQDADADALTGIAITGVSSHGTLQYTLDGGMTWHVAESVSTTNALLLKADTNTRIHFTPGENFNGTLTDAFTFKAWDQTLGDAGTYVDTSNGLSFSTASDSVSIDITPVNDAAVISGTTSASLTETNAVQSTTGTLTSTDVDGTNLFVANTSVAGSNS